MASRGFQLVFLTMLSFVNHTHSVCNIEEPKNDPSDIYPDLNITVLPGLVAHVGDELKIICVADKPRYQFLKGTRPKVPNRVNVAFDDGKILKRCPKNGGRIECVLTVPLTKTSNSVSVACNAANDNGCRTFTVFVKILEKNNLTTPQSGKNKTTESDKSHTSPVSATENIIPPIPTTLPTPKKVVTTENIIPPIPTTLPTPKKGEIYKAILFYKLTKIWIYTVCTNKKANFFGVLCGHSIQGSNDGIMAKRRTNKLWPLYGFKGMKNKNSFRQLHICKLIERTCFKAVYKQQKPVYQAWNPAYKA